MVQGASTALPHPNLLGKAYCTIEIVTGPFHERGVMKTRLLKRRQSNSVGEVFEALLMAGGGFTGVLWRLRREENEKQGGEWAQWEREEEQKWKGFPSYASSL